MATLRQKKLAKNIVDNLSQEKPLNKKELVVSAGYSVMSAESSAHLIIDQKGVQEELKNFGFDPEKAKEVVAQILTGGENDTVKLRAADMIFKVHSTYAPERSVSLSISQNNDAKLDEIIAQIEARLDEPQGTTLS